MNHRQCCQGAYCVNDQEPTPPHHPNRGITGSGKSSSLRLFLNQILRLSSHSRREAKIAEQVKALSTVLDSFGNAKTLMSPNASRHGRYLELHFNDRGRISSAKVLTFGLDKSRLNRLTHEERSYHVFYQFLAGATTAERDHYNLEDPSDYALLASSGTYRLPAGPFSDDSIGMSDLRASMRTLGFKPKHMSSIFSLLVAILLLGNLQFHDGDAHTASAYIHNTQVLDHVARLLGTTSEDLSQVLTNKTSYVRKELYTVLLNAEQSSAQRDQCVRDLYAILFAFIVETSNHRLAPSAKDPSPPTQIILLDQPGYQTRGPAGTGSISLTGATPLVSVYGQNGFDEFCINFADELLQSYVLRNTFEDRVGYNSEMTRDGIALPSITTMDNGACVELLRGAQLNERAQRKPGGMLGVISKACLSYKSGKGGDRRNEDTLQDLTSKFGVHASFVSSPPQGDRNLFGINHYSGSATYDISKFIEKDSDLLDSAFVSLLRSSMDPFVSKLMSGPSLAAEKHSKDESIIVQAQVSSRPLRQPTPILTPDGSLPSTNDEHPRLDPGKTYPVTTQLNFTLSEVFSSLDRTHIWNISCIRPNDSGSSNSFDKRRVKAQIRSLLLPDISSRNSTEFVADYGVGEFCERFVPTMRGSELERITQCARANGWKDGLDYALGNRRVWLSYSAWKMVEDPLRAMEKDLRKGPGDEGESAVGDDNTEYTHQEGLVPPTGGYFNESADNLLLTRTGTNGTQWQDPNGELSYGGGGLNTPNLSKGFGAWDSDQKGETPPYSPNPAKDGEMIVKEAPTAVEEVPSSRSRRWWLFIVRLFTWWIPGFLLRIIGRMKRPDVRLAWREKLTIFLLIFLLNGTILFYIAVFGQLLCPNLDKAWTTSQVAQHTGSNDFYVSVQGQVYDVSNFVQGDHSDITGQPSNGADTLDAVAGIDMTYYFPVPLTLGCPGLVSDPTLSLTPKNFTVLAPTGIHVSGALQQTSQALKQSDWYTAVFQPKMDNYHVGALVWESSDIAAQAADTSIAKYVILSLLRMFMKSNFSLEFGGFGIMVFMI
jgi:chitin synthase